MIISYEIENVEKVENLTKQITKVRKAQAKKFTLTLVAIDLSQLLALLPLFSHNRALFTIFSSLHQKKNIVGPR